MISLGKVTIASGGTPQAITTSNQPGTRGKIVLTPFPGNAAVVYVGLEGMNTSTGVGVLGVIGKAPTTGQYPSLEIAVPLAQGGVSAKAIYIDGTTNDGVFAAIY
jgi:hypothetical protein